MSGGGDQYEDDSEERGCCCLFGFDQKIEKNAGKLTGGR